MLKLKPMQNSESRELWEVVRLPKKPPVMVYANIVTTMTKLLAYNDKGDLIGKAGVKYSKDFDYDALFKAARKKENLSADM